MCFHFLYIWRPLRVLWGMFLWAHTSSCAQWCPELGAHFIDDDREALTRQVPQRDGRRAEVTMDRFIPGYVCRKLGWTLPDAGCLRHGRCHPQPPNPCSWPWLPRVPAPPVNSSSSWQCFFISWASVFLCRKERLRLDQWFQNIILRVLSGPFGHGHQPSVSFAWYFSIIQWTWSS